jgi:hypothetical protein
MKRPCQECGRKAVYRSAGKWSGGRYRGRPDHDLCPACNQKYMEQAGIDVRDEHIAARELTPIRED